MVFSNGRSSINSDCHSHSALQPFSARRDQGFNQKLKVGESIFLGLKQDEKKGGLGYSLLNGATDFSVTPTLMPVLQEFLLVSHLTALISLFMFFFCCETGKSLVIDVTMVIYIVSTRMFCLQ